MRTTSRNRQLNEWVSSLWRFKEFVQGKKNTISTRPWGLMTGTILNNPSQNAALVGNKAPQPRPNFCLTISQVLWWSGLLLKSTGQRCTPFSLGVRHLGLSLFNISINRNRSDIFSHRTFDMGFLRVSMRYFYFSIWINFSMLIVISMWIDIH